MTGAAARVRTPPAPRGRSHRPAFRRLAALGFLVAVLTVWEVAIRSGVIDERLLVPPSGVAATFWTDITEGRLLTHIQSSGTVFLAGYLIAVSLAVPLGLLMGASRRLEVVLNPYVLGMYATPSQAFFPLIIIVLGIGFLPRLVLVILFVFFIVVLSTTAAVKTVDPTLLKVGRAFGASRLAMFRKVILPAASPLIVAGLRLGVGRAAIGIFLGELVGATQGVGFYILRAGTEFRVDRVLVGVLILVVATVALTELIRLVEQRLTPWRQRTQL
jgi:ABC-type nitrate/sulfonate/bicarbonate transport system permease component